MKQYFAVIVFIASLFLTNSVVAQSKKTAVRGTIADVYCLVTKDMEGKSHQQCAATCTNSGSPLGIKDDKTGTVYLTAGHQKDRTFASSGLEKYVEQHVTVIGTVYERDGLKMIVVDSVSPAK